MHSGIHAVAMLISGILGQTLMTSQHNSLYSRLVPFRCQSKSNRGARWLPSSSQEGDSVFGGLL